MTTKIEVKMDAINSLSPDLAFHLSPDGVISLANIDGQENKGVIPSEDEIQAEITRIQGFQPTQDWMDLMAVTDFEMPRYLEDLITDNPSLTIHENMKTRYDEKVTLRATKP